VGKLAIFMVIIVVICFIYEVIKDLKEDQEWKLRIDEQIRNDQKRKKVE